MTNDRITYGHTTLNLGMTNGNATAPAFISRLSTGSTAFRNPKSLRSFNYFTLQCQSTNKTTAPAVDIVNLTILYAKQYNHLQLQNL